VNPKENTMIKSIALVLVLGITAVLIYAATRPDTLRVQRSAHIRAPADRIHPLISDLRQFNTWNPYAKKDANMTVAYRGNASGPGAGYDFSGNKDVGKGSIEITESASPRKVTMKLDMIEPMEGHNIIEFSLAPRGDTTEVTWSMQGASPYIAKVMGIFINMDQMIGKDFEAGLANLKAAAER
jgi:hypothetical protein